MKFVKNISGKIAVLVAVFSIAMLTLAIADEYAYSRVYFNIPVNLQFSVQMRGASAANISFAPAPGNVTEDIYFNTTNQNAKLVDACRMGYGDAANCQSPGNPILLFINLANVNMNLTIRDGGATALNATYAISINATNVTAKNAGCPLLNYPLANGTNVTTTATAFVTYLCPNNQTNVFLYGNFTNAPAGTSSAYYLNYSSQRAP